MVSAKGAVYPRTVGTSFRTRILPVLAILVALVVSNGLGVVVVFQHGFGFSFSWLGALLQLPIALGLGAACFFILTKGKGLTAIQSGFCFARGMVLEAGVAVLVGVACVALLMAGLAGLGALDLLRASSSLGALGVLVGLAASLINAALQDFGLGSLALAASREGEVSAGALLVSVGLFTLTHAPGATSVIYLLNVALFGLTLVLLFFRTPQPSYGAAIGLHGGWNFALLLSGGVPGAEALAFARATPHDTLLSGGSAGPESGLVYLLLVATLATVSYALRRRGTLRG